MTESLVRRRYTEVSDLYTRMFGAVTLVDADDLQLLERNSGDARARSSMPAADPAT